MTNSSDEVRAVVARSLLGTGLFCDDDWEPRRVSISEALDVVLPALGGTWSIEHTHVWPARDVCRVGHGELIRNCQDPCPYKSGRHVVRRQWSSDEVTS